MTDERGFRIGVFILPGFPMACLTSLIEPLRAANEIGGRNVFSWSVITETGQEIEASAGIRFQPDQSLYDELNVDLLIVLSSPQGILENPKSANARLRHLARHGMAMGSVSGGVFPLARTGLLDSFSTSVHWCYRAAFESEFPDFDIRDEVIAIDRQRFTASGAQAGFDLMLHIIEERMGVEIMTEVACWFQHALVRSPGVQQKTPGVSMDRTTDTLPDKIVRAISIFSDNLEDPVPIGDVAKEVGLSARQMERVFKSSTGQSPANYYRELRLRAARQRVIYTADSLTAIALSVGYNSTTTLTRYYRDAFGLSPQEERRKVNQFRVESNKPLPSI